MAIFHKCHYSAIATELSKAHEDKKFTEMEFQRIKSFLKRIFREDNEKFSPEKFERACGTITVPW